MANEVRRIFVEAPSGGRFEAEVPCGTKLSKLAADFFESQNWPLQDSRGRGQRAVVELVSPQNPDDTKRLNGERDICAESIEDGDILRVFPESIAGLVDQHARLMALVTDHKEMLDLSARNARITFTTNRTHAPDRYEITFHYTSFTELPPGQAEPQRADRHQVEILLSADYPTLAPIVTWLTPIFHPNIRAKAPGERELYNNVCIGVLREQYLPGMGLARLVHMLAEMVQWRNFDAFHPFNPEASEWAKDLTHWPAILAIGGHPFQGPIEQLLRMVDRATQPAIQFRPVSVQFRPTGR